MGLQRYLILSEATGAVLVIARASDVLRVSA